MTGRVQRSPFARVMRGLFSSSPAARATWQTAVIVLAVSAFIAAVNAAPALMFWITVPALVALVWWVLYAPMRDREHVLRVQHISAAITPNEARALRSTWESASSGDSIEVARDAEYLGEWRGGRFV